MTDTLKPNDLIELRADPVTRDIIDVADGIERLMGNRELYARMLRRFRREYQDATLPIRTAMGDQDKRTAHRLVHSLKGAAGMIGAHRLQQRASILEQAIRTDAEDQRELLASLTPEFQRVLLLLDVLLEGKPPAGMPVQVPSRPLLEDSALLNRLMQLLSDGDGAAVDLLEESSASLRVILGEATLLRVTEAINDFDFDEALEVLGETSAGSGI